MNNNTRLEKNLKRNISIIIIAILFIPLMIILLMLYQHIQYNSLLKDNFGKETEKIAITTSNEIQSSLNQYMHILNIWPFESNEKYTDNMFSLIDIDNIYIYDELTNIAPYTHTELLEKYKDLREGTYLKSTVSNGNIIVKKVLNNRKKSILISLGDSYWKKHIKTNSMFYIMIFDRDKELIFSNNSIKGTPVEKIIGTPKFNTFYKQNILGKQGYTYYDNYGTYGRQTIIGYSPLKDILNSSTIGSIVVFRETSKLIPDENISKLALFIATFIGGTILVKLIFKFSEIIITQFLKIAQQYNKASEEKEAIRKKLVISEKLASLGRVTSGIAHEIGNPLSSILSTTQVLISHDLSKKKSREFILKIQQDATRIDNLIREFLYFNSNRKDNYILIDINNLLEESIESIPANRKNKNIELFKDFSPNIPDIFGDMKKLEIAFSNIILNAYQATDNAGLIYIRTTIEKSMVSVSITDNGNGISSEEINKIFDPFFTTKEVRKGFGLGLFICQQIIEAHQGTIKVISQVGRGTEFIILLPTAEDKGDR